MNYIFTVLRNFLRNVHFLGKVDIEEYTEKIAHTKALKMLFDSFFSEEQNRIPYIKELAYLSDKDELEPIPYPEIRKTNIQVVFERKKKLPYVKHGEKKLYFPRQYKFDLIEKIYRSYMDKENITSTKFEGIAPHQYQMNDFCVENGDVLLDIGCAEGLFALDVVDKVRKVYLFESDPIWVEPLEATFEPYRDKVTFINKNVSNKESETETKLDSCIHESDDATFFVKMDIEGGEELVVKGNMDFFKMKKTKTACCTYHCKNHYDSISKTFELMGYKVSSSDGYILCFMDKNITQPFFRKGLIRAKNF